ncbi:acetyl-CoA carboxylase [alpha proteobacterium BAL199]|jgi:peptide-methionine (S)-S-oxide reductase|nr:acetyl-CoA carboxylase [alpha proteobacterium BAL199]
MFRWLFGGKPMTPSSFPDPAIDLPAGAYGERTVVLGGGCFWCTEAVFKELSGVLSVRPGYAGGTAETADYRTVCSGTTGHAEVIGVTYDPSRISLGALLKVFFSVAHDPTQLNRQGNDRGSQYRSAVFYADADEKRVAEAYIAQIDAAGVFDAPIVTTVEPLDAFYEAEEYHFDYAARNPSQPYITHVSAPKVEKLRRAYPERLKSEKAGA